MFPATPGSVITVRLWIGFITVCTVHCQSAFLLRFIKLLVRLIISIVLEILKLLSYFYQSVDKAWTIRRWENLIGLLHRLGLYWSHYHLQPHQRTIINHSVSLVVRCVYLITNPYPDYWKLSWNCGTCKACLPLYVLTLAAPSALFTAVLALCNSSFGFGMGRGGLLLSTYIF